MKRTANVVIIGGGVVGCAIAYSLAKRINDVVLVEREGIASQASGSNYGMVWQQTRLPGLDLTMARRCLAMYDYLREEVFDIDIEYQKRGGMTLVTSEASARVMEKVVQEKQRLGVPVRFVWAGDVRHLEPNVSAEVVGSTWCEEEAQLNPMLVSLAFARAAKRHGAEINTETEVAGIRVERGRVRGVKTTRGEIETDVVVNAAGCWGRQVARLAGVDVPVWPQRLQSMVTEPMPDLVYRVLQGGREVTEEEAEHPEKVLAFAVELRGTPTEEALPREKLEDSIFPYIKPTVSGNMVIGTTSEFVGYDKTTLPRALTLMGQKAVRLVPALRRANIIRSWSNFVPFTFDSLPILGTVPQVEGLILAVGHAHAMSHAPATGEALAELIVNGSPDMDLSEASIERFSCGRD
ncbi:MAG: FAD-binding oxidoreductase [Bacillota bacterium]|nr:FAD-binding oxidoreductase [Bacillota bacterium]